MKLINHVCIYTTIHTTIKVHVSIREIIQNVSHNYLIKISVKHYMPEMYSNTGKKNPSSNQEQRMQKKQFKFASTSLN